LVLVYRKNFWKTEEKKRIRDLVEVVVGSVKIVESEKTAEIKKKSSRFFHT